MKKVYQVYGRLSGGRSTEIKNEFVIAESKEKAKAASMYDYIKSVYYRRDLTPADVYEFEGEIFDIHFNDDTNSNSKGFEVGYKEALNYIKTYNGTNESYFADYKGGTVSIVNNETGEHVYEEEVK